ncbi:hypothetical protein V1477_002747, partial [Vespula maculifrons]
MRRLGRCWDRLTNRNATLVDPGLKARPKTPPLCLSDSRVYLVAKAPRAPAGAVTLESSCVYDGLRGIPIQRSRDIRKQYPACTEFTLDILFTCELCINDVIKQIRVNYLYSAIQTVRVAVNADLRTNVYFTRKPNAEPRLLQHRENASN